MPMDRKQYRAMKAKLDLTNFARHTKQADRAASHCGITLAGFVLVFSHGGEDEVHYFDAPWIAEDVAADVRRAAAGQLAEIASLEGNQPNATQSGESPQVHEGPPGGTAPEGNLR